MTDIAQTKSQPALLVVDDQASVREVLEYVLTLAGYRVLTADSGAAAIALAAREAVDGALIDFQMPAMNGLETGTMLKAQAASLGRTLRIWLMTGASRPALEQQSKRIGAYGVLTKPFDYAALCARLDKDLASPVPKALLGRSTRDGRDDADDAP